MTLRFEMPEFDSGGKIFQAGSATDDVEVTHGGVVAVRIPAGDSVYVRSRVIEGRVVFQWYLIGRVVETRGADDERASGIAERLRDDGLVLLGGSHARQLALEAADLIDALRRKVKG